MWGVRTMQIGNTAPDVNDFSYLKKVFDAIQVQLTMSKVMLRCAQILELQFSNALRIPACRSLYLGKCMTLAGTGRRETYRRRT